MDLLSIFCGGDMVNFIVDSVHNIVHIYDTNGHPYISVEHKDLLNQDWVTTPDGHLIGIVHNGIDGSKIFMSPEGNIEFIAKNNLMGGYDIFDPTGTLIAQTLPTIDPFSFNLF